MSHQAEALERRYGAPDRGRRALVIAGVVLLAAAGLGWLLWATMFHGRPLVRSALVSYDDVGEHAITATVTVIRRDADVNASCLLRAFAEDHSIVGELNFAVPASAPTTVTLEQTVRTERRATAVQMMGCTADGQGQRR